MDVVGVDEVDVDDELLGEDMELLDVEEEEEEFKDVLVLVELLMLLGK